MAVEDIDSMSDDELSALTDPALRDLTGDAILDAAVMAGSRWASEYDARVDRVYRECARRSRGIYQAAFNEVARSQGHSSMVQPAREGVA